MAKWSKSIRAYYFLGPFRRTLGHAPSVLLRCPFGTPSVPKGYRRGTEGVPKGRAPVFSGKALKNNTRVCFLTILPLRKGPKKKKIRAYFSMSNFFPDFSQNNPEVMWKGPKWQNYYFFRPPECFAVTLGHRTTSPCEPGVHGCSFDGFGPTYEFYKFSQKIRFSWSELYLSYFDDSRDVKRWFSRSSTRTKRLKSGTFTKKMRKWPSKLKLKKNSTFW